MALATYQLQGSCKICPPRPSSWSSGSKLKHFVELHTAQQKVNFVSLKCKSCLSIGAPIVLRSSCKQLKVSAFKGNGHGDESGDRATGLKSLKSSVKLSYPPEESKETLVESPRGKNIPLSYSSADETSTRFLSIHNLFKSWLSLPLTLTPNEAVQEPIEEPSSIEISGAQSLVERKDRSEIVKAVLCYFRSQDATVMMTLLIFVPWFLTVNFIYGAEVSKELTPLWILGPLFVALYVKMLRNICALYVFSFKQTAKFAKNLPTHYLLAFNYIARGQLKEDVRARLVQPAVDLKNLDYKELLRRPLIDLQRILVERYLDFIESVWPYYCRTIRVLKRANLI